MIDLTNEDNMKLMARYPDNYFELAIVDPPYGIGETGTGRNCYDKRRPHIKTIRKEKYTKKTGIMQHRKKSILLNYLE